MYLQVCKILGVEINLSKSISSPNKPVFEFAKRTYNNGVDVSPVPFKPLIHPSLADIVGNYLLFSKKGLIKTSGILLRFLTRFGSINQNDLLHPILAILGAYTSMKLVPHRWLVESLVDPKDEEFDFDSSPLRIPLVSSIKLIMDVSSGMPNEQYPFSHQETRSEFYDDYEDEFANVISNEALMLARKLEVDYDDIILSASETVCPLTLCENGVALLIRTEGIWGSVQGWVEENFLS